MSAWLTRPSRHPVLWLALILTAIAAQDWIVFIAVEMMMRIG